MSKKRLDKKNFFLEPQFKDVLVCQTKNLRPYLEVFVQEPENVSQQGLGTLFGILEINDHSEDSSYVVNYIISIIKKEYFINSKRGPIESFEAALHKANLALAKVAEHGNINWIGHLNAVCAVIEKNNIHLAQTGTAFAFLLRSKKLVNVSGGEENSENPNPLKTFQEVVSGRMETADKVILTTDSLFNIFSLEEIKRGAIKFSRTEFTRFLHTALVNELDMAAVLVVDIEEKEEQSIPESPKITRKINAFSQKAFIQKPPPWNDAPAEENKSELIAELKKELEKSQGGYVDEKTGHIYIKDEPYSSEESDEKNYVRGVLDKLSDTSANFSSSVKEKARAGASSLSGILSRHKPDSNQKSAPLEEIDTVRTPGNGYGQAVIKSIRNCASFLSRSAFRTRTFIAKKLLLFYKITLPAIIGFLRIRVIRLKSGLARITNLAKKSDPELTGANPSFSAKSQTSSRAEKKEWFQKLSGNTPDSSDLTQFSGTAAGFDPEDVYDAKSKVREKLLPSFSRLKIMLSKFDKRDKIAAVAVVLLLVAGPYFLLRLINRPEQKKEVDIIETPKSPLPLENDKNITRIENLQTVFSGNDVSDVVNVNGNIWAVQGQTLAFPEKNKAYEIPDEFKNPDYIFEMDDLNFILLVKNNKLLSFSVTAGKFQPNNINLTMAKPVGRSYLTYAYFLDPEKNQIYRYPRAEGGFGEKSDWLKEKMELADFKEIAVNENIFITDGKSILKLFRGKKQDWTIEETATPVSIDKIFTKPDSENLYALDSKNSRIIRLDKDGKITAQYYHPEINDARSFSVNEESSIVYFSVNNQVNSFKIN